MTDEIPAPPVPRVLADEPPTTVAVYLLLRDYVGSPATQRQLSEAGQLPGRTVRDGLTRLVEAELVTTRPCTDGDSRKKWYDLVREHREMRRDPSL